MCHTPFISELNSEIEYNDVTSHIYVFKDFIKFRTIVILVHALRISLFDIQRVHARQGGPVAFQNRGCRGAFGMVQNKRADKL